MRGAGLGQLSSRRHLIRLTPFGTFPSRGDSPLCGEMSAEQTKGSEGFQNFLLFAKPQSIETK